MTQEEIAKAIKERPYEHCDECKLNAKHGGRCCMVADKYQRLPRELYRGALGMCIKIGGNGS